MARYYADLALTEDITALRTELTVNKQTVALNEFMQNYIAHILFAITQAFGERPSSVKVCIDKEDIRIYSGGRELSFEMGFAKQLIESTLKGVLSPLNGIFWLEEISIVSDS